MKKAVPILILFCLQMALFRVQAETQVLGGHLRPSLTTLAPTGRLPGSNQLRLSIVLPLRNAEGLTNLLQQIYDPSSPGFHRYLQPAEFARRFGPSEEDYQTVIDFVRAQGLVMTGAHSNRTLVDVAGSVDSIERAFHVTLRTYRHPRENRSFFAPDAEPSIDLPVKVLHVVGLDNFTLPHPLLAKEPPRPTSSGQAPQLGSGPGGGYMGKDFRAAYVPGLPLTGAGQTVALLEFDGFFPGDVAAYKSFAGLPNVPVKTVLLDGFTGSPGSGNDEVALDIDMAISMAPGLDSVIVYEGAITDDILDRIATDNLARQISASWTYPIDAGSEQLFLQFAAQGQSFFNASGDSGAYLDGIPSPSDDPNITSVGGTTLTTTSKGGPWKSETVWNWNDGYASSGGVSTNYLIPSWQQGLSMTANKGSTIWRNIPDVALTADNIFIIANGGSPVIVGGTSCATPLWAAYTALANQQAAANGQPPVGFLNPAVYQIGRGSSYLANFHDITTGSNAVPFGDTNLYYAVKGYDLCTGWGTPSGGNLINRLAPPNALQIAPMGGFTSSGGSGGPFTPVSQVFALTNLSTNSVSWAAGAESPWLSVSPAVGSLSPGGSGSTITFSINAQAAPLEPGIYSSQVWFTNLTDGSLQTRPVTLSIVQPPVITTQPANLAILGGTNAVLTVSATGGLPLFFQWLMDGTNLVDGGNVSGSQFPLSSPSAAFGSDSSSLILSNATPANAGVYSVAVSNAAGQVFSVDASVTFIPSAPVLVLQPASQTDFLAANVQFTCVALGNAPISYQWRLDGTNLSDGGEFSGSSSPVLTITGASSADIGAYDVVVSNNAGVVFSQAALLSLDAPQASQNLLRDGGFESSGFSLWNQSGNLVDCSVSGSSPAVFSGQYGALLGASGSLGYLSQTLATTPGQSYLISLWMDSPDGVGPNEFLVAWNGEILFDQTNLSAFGWTNLQFQTRALGGATVLQIGFRDDQSFLGLDDINVSPLVGVSGAPVIVSQPVAATVAPAGNGASLSVLAGGGLPLSYQWRFNSVNIPNATNSTLSLSSLATNQSGIYSVVVSNSFGSVASSDSTLTVLPGTVTLISFDDLSDSDFVLSPVDFTEILVISNGYKYLNWTNFQYLDGVTNLGPSGFNAGVVSAPNIAYNGDGAPAILSSGVTPFDLLSARVTAAWNENLRLQVLGYNGTNLLYNNYHTLSPTTPELINFGLLGVTTVEFISAGGTPYPPYYGAGEQFVMDNLEIIFPPEPPTVVVQPSDQSSPLRGPAVFSVIAAGAPPLKYQWMKNGATLTGATSPTFTNEVAAATDNGAEFSCRVENTYGSTVTSNAALRVTSGIVEVLNGGFELGTFQYWTLSGNTGSSFVGDFDVDGYPVNSGNFAAQMGPDGTLGYIRQSIPTTPGASYQISCWLYSDGQTPNEFQTLWNGTKILDKLDLPADGWTNILLVAKATLASTVLEFGFRDDPGDLSFDDVVVTEIAPLIQPSGPANGEITLTWAAATNYTYQLQYKSVLTETNWINFGAPLKTPIFLIPPGGVAGTNAQEYYRLKAIP